MGKGNHSPSPSLKTMATLENILHALAQFYCWAWHCMVWNISLATAVPAVFPPSLLDAPVYLLRGVQSGKQRNPDPLQALLSDSQNTGALSTLLQTPNIAP